MRGWGGSWVAVVAAARALPLLSACSGDTLATVEPSTVTSTVTVTEEASTVTVTVTAEPTTAEPSPATEEPTLLERLKSAKGGEPWLSKVLDVMRVSADQVDVKTSIIDPRGGEGSAAAVEALEVCEAVIDLLVTDGESEIKVFVYESDGSTFAYAGSTSNYECVEY